MNYELAKELKDAGFPQQERSIIGGNEDRFVSDPHHLNHYFYVPTLEELIEACGDRFRHLVHEKDVRSFNEWYASDGTFVFKEDAYWGMTPSEAVARLWLAISENKKSTV